MTSAALGLLAAQTPASAADDNAYTVTPYRPTLSTPANLSTPGWLELESGLQRLHNPDGAQRDSLPYTIKLALSPDWGLRVGGGTGLYPALAAAAPVEKMVPPGGAGG